MESSTGGEEKNSDSAEHNPTSPAAALPTVRRKSPSRVVQVKHLPEKTPNTTDSETGGGGASYDSKFGPLQQKMLRSCPVVLPPIKT